MSALASVLIVDDEPVARRGLRAILKGMAGIGAISECGTGLEAVDAIAASPPDLVLLDVQMPDLDGLAVIERVGAAAMPPVVFVTAHDSFAIRAFELAAVDYVVKPYTEQRIRGAVSRALRTGADRNASQVLERLVAAMSATPGTSPGASPRAPESAEKSASGGYLQRILAVIGPRAIVIPVTDIVWIKADDYCATVITPAGSSVIRESLTDLEQRLDPQAFLRVHRSAIVRIDAVRAVERTKTGLSVVLADDTRVRVSRSRAGAVVAALGGYA